MRNLPDVNSAAVTKAPTHVSRQAMSTSGRNLKMTAKRAHVLPPEGLPTRRDPLRPQCRELPRRSLHRGRRQLLVMSLDPNLRWSFLAHALRGGPRPFCLLAGCYSYKAVFRSFRWGVFGPLVLCLGEFVFRLRLPQHRHARFRAGLGGSLRL